RCLRHHIAAAASPAGRRTSSPQRPPAHRRPACPIREGRERERERERGGGGKERKGEPERRLLTWHPDMWVSR
ncbi:Os11g0585100, partial [Oryza sativa Japonica Group]